MKKEIYKHINCEMCVIFLPIRTTRGTADHLGAIWYLQERFVKELTEKISNLDLVA